MGAMMPDLKPIPSTAAPAWKLVPLEPTNAMLAAGQRAWARDPLRKSSTLWRAMAEAVQPQRIGPAFDVSKVSESDRFGGATYALKAHFHTRDHAETVRALLLEQPLPPGPFPAQFAEQAELIDTQKLEQALAWLGCSAPSGEMLSWWVGREVNRLLDAVLEQRATAQRTHPELEESERVERLIDACEGELDGLAVDHATACRIMFYIDNGTAPDDSPHGVVVDHHQGPEPSDADASKDRP